MYNKKMYNIFLSGMTVWYFILRRSIENREYHILKCLRYPRISALFSSILTFGMAIVIVSYLNAGYTDEYYYTLMPQLLFGGFVFPIINYYAIKKLKTRICADALSKINRKVSDGLYLFSWFNEYSYNNIINAGINGTIDNILDREVREMFEEASRRAEEYKNQQSQKEYQHHNSYYSNDDYENTYEEYQQEDDTAKIAKNILESFGLSSDETDLTKIKKAYRRLAKQYHPDVKETGSPEKFKELKNDYDFIETYLKKSA